MLFFSKKSKNKLKYLPFYAVVVVLVLVEVLVLVLVVVDVVVDVLVLVDVLVVVVVDVDVLVVVDVVVDVLVLVDVVVVVDVLVDVDVDVDVDVLVVVNPIASIKCPKSTSCDEKGAAASKNTNLSIYFGVTFPLLFGNNLLLIFSP